MEAGNLVLLCKFCHREAPNVTDPKFMWLWLRSTCEPFYDTYWSARGAEEFQRIFKRKPFAGLDELAGADERARSLFKALFDQVTIHWGEARLNPATVAWIYWRIEQELQQS